MSKGTSDFSSLFGLILASSIIAAAITMAAFFSQSSTTQTNKIAAIQGCYEVARTTKLTSGRGDTSDWQVTTTDVNQDLLTKCLQTKGY